MKPELLRSLLDRALEEELGLVIETNNPHQIEIKIHEVKKTTLKYDGLIVAIPSTPETVFLVKKTVELDEDV